MLVPKPAGVRVIAGKKEEEKKTCREYADSCFTLLSKAGADLGSLPNTIPKINVVAMGDNINYTSVTVS